MHHTQNIDGCHVFEDYFRISDEILKASDRNPVLLTDTKYSVHCIQMHSVILPFQKQFPSRFDPVVPSMLQLTFQSRSTL